MAKAKPKPKAMTGAERQAAYRKRQRESQDRDDDEKERCELKAWISGHAFRAVARLARHHGVTKREMLERLILDGEKKTSDKIRDTPADKDYWKVF